MGAYDYVQTDNILFIIEDFINQYESYKRELAEVEANCKAYLIELDEKKDKLAENF